MSYCNLESLANPSNPRISANIICHNNINSIETCLKSMEELVDEIVVVDGGSTDGTIDILQKYNCRIINNPNWQGYSHQRNLALEASTGDWIIKMDSDEYLSQELRDNLRELASSKFYSGYRTFSRWIQKLDDPKYISQVGAKGRYKSVLRMFRNKAGISYKGEVHESLFGLENLRIKKMPLNQNCIYHLDVAINDYSNREAKVKAREEILAGSGHPEEYLPENFDFDSYPVPIEDQGYLKYLNVQKLQSNKL